MQNNVIQTPNENSQNVLSFQSYMQFSAGKQQQATQVSI
jgi:hypothetical protein